MKKKANKRMLFSSAYKRYRLLFTQLLPMIVIFIAGLVRADTFPPVPLIYPESQDSFQGKNEKPPDWRNPKLPDFKKFMIDNDEFAAFAGNPILERISLQDLEKDLQAAPEVLIAVAELEQSISMLEQEQAKSGLKVFGSAGTGLYREQVTEDVARDYQNASLKIGLIYPLFGTREKEQINLLKAEAKTLENRHKVELAKAKSLTALRIHYVNYWGCLRKIALSQAFLENQDGVEKILLERTRKGYLLESDRQEFLAAFSLVRRNVANLTARQERALSILRMLTSPDLKPFYPLTPALPEPGQTLPGLRADLVNSHPEILLLQDVVEKKLQLLRLTGNTDMDADVSLAGNTTSEFTGEDGYGVSLNFNLRFPFEIAKAKTAEKQAALMDLKKTQHELALKTTELSEDLSERWYQFYAAKENYRFAIQSLKATLERLRENLLRTAYLPASTLDDLNKSRIDYYTIATDYVDAELLMYQRHAKLMELAKTNITPQKPAGSKPEKENKKPAADKKEASLNPNWLKIKPVRGQEKSKKRPVGDQINKLVKSQVSAGYGTYVWDSRALLNNPTIELKLWKTLSENGIQRILLSFDDRQLKEYQRLPARSKLKNFIEKAKGQGIGVELLLGEPLWILTEHRRDLLIIIQQLADLPFAGLHLDLEPNQLNASEYSDEYVLTQLLRTLEAVKGVSPWPIGLSIHPRYMENKKNRICIGWGLSNLRLDEITLMVYVSEPKRVAKRVNAILNEYPEVTFSVAQSVEPVLAESESYAAHGRIDFQGKMEELRSAIDKPNFSTIVIQSWKDYLGLKP